MSKISPIYNEEDSTHKYFPSYSSPSFASPELTATESQHTLQTTNTTVEFEQEVYSNSNGCYSRIERIPLWFKLALIVLIANIGMYLFGILLIAENVQDFKQVKQGKIAGLFSILAVNMGQLLHETQKERGISSKYFAAKGHQYALDLAAQRNITDSVLPLFEESLQQVRSSKPADMIVSYLDRIDRYILNLQDMRRNISDLAVTTAEGIAFYTNWNKLMLDLVDVIYSNSETGTKQFFQVFLGFSHLIRYKEETGLKRALVSNGLTLGYMLQKQFEQVVSQIAKLDILLQLFMLHSTSKHIKHLNEIVLSNSEYFTVQTQQSSVTANYMNITAGTKLTTQDWWNNVTVVIDSLKIVEDLMAVDIIQIAREEDHSAVAAIIYSAIIVIFLSIFSIMVAVFFSRTIIGPWRRLLAMQQQTLQLFVPRQFLLLMNHRNLSEVKLGDYSERNMEVMFADIRGFTLMSEKMKPLENLAFLNNYFDKVNPAIKHNDGFIDSFQGDGFMALFSGRNSSSVKAAIEIQKIIREYNLVNGLSIKVGIGVHAGSVVAGLVGANGRVQGTIISDTVNTSSRLESLTKRYGAKIVASSSVLATIPEHFTAPMRYLGAVRAAGKYNYEDLYELFDDECEHDQLKIAHIEVFENGIKHMFSEPYNIDEAVECFASILVKDPNDLACTLRYHQCTELLNDPKKLAEWHGVEVLTEK
jgi:class 3 adenylate cyclase